MKPLILTFIFIIVMLISATISYIFNEQQHRHKLELKNVEQGCFKKAKIKKSNIFIKALKDNLISILIIGFLIILLIFLGFIFHVPSDFTKYVVEIIK